MPVSLVSEVGTKVASRQAWLLIDAKHDR